MLEAQEIELYFMSLLEAGFLPLQGVLNMCIYLFTSGIYRDILNFFLRRRLYRNLLAVSVDFPRVSPEHDTYDSGDDDGAFASSLPWCRRCGCRCCVFVVTVGLTYALPLGAPFRLSVPAPELIVAHDRLVNPPSPFSAPDLGRESHRKEILLKIWAQK
jgi:hypothetical protein